MTKLLLVSVSEDVKEFKRCKNFGNLKYESWVTAQKFHMRSNGQAKVYTNYSLIGHAQRVYSIPNITIFIT